MIWTVPQKRRAIGWIGPLLVVLGLASPILAQDLASNRWSVTAAGALAYDGNDFSTILFRCGKEADDPNVEMIFYVPLFSASRDLQAMAPEMEFFDVIGYRSEQSSPTSELQKYRGQVTLTYEDGVSDIIRADNFIESSFSFSNSVVPQRFRFNAEQPYAFSEGDALPMDVELHGVIEHLLADIRTISLVLNKADELALKYDFKIDPNDDPNPHIQQFLRLCPKRNVQIEDPAMKLLR